MVHGCNDCLWRRMLQHLHLQATLLSRSLVQSALHVCPTQAHSSSDTGPPCSLHRCQGGVRRPAGRVSHHVQVHRLLLFTVTSLTTITRFHVFLTAQVVYGDLRDVIFEQLYRFHVQVSRLELVLQVSRPGPGGRTAQPRGAT